MRILFLGIKNLLNTSNKMNQRTLSQRKLKKLYGMVENAAFKDEGTIKVFGLL